MFGFEKQSLVIFIISKPFAGRIFRADGFLKHGCNDTRRSPFTYCALSLVLVKKAFLQLHIAVFLAGFTAILGKLIGLNEGLLVWYRLLLTVGILGLILYFKKQLELVSIREFMKITGVGVLIAFHWVCFYGSIKYANASVALVCLSAAGFFTSILEPLILQTRFNFREVLIGLVAIAGIYLIFDFHPQFKTGIIFGILSSLGSSLFPIFNKQLLHRHQPRVLTLYELGGGLIVLTLILPFYLTGFNATYFYPSVADWGWLVVLAVICTIVAFDLQLNALKKISAFTANLSYNLEPVYGIILAFLIFQENKSFHKEFFIGVGLILLAVLLQMSRVIYHSRKAA